MKTRPFQSRKMYPLLACLFITAQTGVALADDGTATGSIDNDEALLSIGLEELLNTPMEVWSATKTKSTTNEAPSVITVITRQDLNNWSYRSLADALNHVVGFFVVDDHILPNVGVRGVAGGLMGESGTIKVMIDGRSVVFHSTSGNWLGAELIPLTAVERIEIIRGPVSSLYGADAFLAIINVVTRKGEAIDGADADAYMSLTGHQNLGGGIDTSLGIKKGAIDILASARIDNEDRSGLQLPDSSPAPAIPPYNDNQRGASSLLLKSKVALLKIGYQPSEKHQLTLMGYLSMIERGAEFSAWAPLSYGYSDTGILNYSRVSLYNSIVALTYSGDWTDVFNLDAKVHFFMGGPQDDDRIEVGSSLYYIRREFGYRGVDGSLEGRWSFGEKVVVVLGTEMLLDVEDPPGTSQVLKSGSDQYDTGDVLRLESNHADKLNFVNFGAFSQAIFKPIDRFLNVIAGARYDHHNVFGSQLSSRLAAVTNPLKPLYIKIMYGSAYKAPSPLLLHATPYEVGDVVGNESLEPQFVHSVEGNVSLKWEYFSFATGLAYNFLTNKAEFVQQGVNRTAVNLSETESFSWETEINAGYKDLLKGYLSSEVQLTRRNMGLEGYQADLYGSKSVIYPPYILRGGILGKISTIPLAGNVTGVYVGPRRSSDMNSLENFKAYTLKPYLLWDAAVSLQDVELLAKRPTTFRFSVKNILNASGANPGFAGIDYPLAERTFFFDIQQAL